VLKPENDSPDKLDETKTIRVPGELKVLFNRLPIEERHIAEHRMRLVMARAVHEHTFNPRDFYLGE